MSVSPVIVGAGINGLTAAYVLARAGMKPLVLERETAVGGGEVTREIHPGFHAPVYSHELMLSGHIAREMDLTRHGLQLLRGDVDVCAPSLDGPPIVVYHDVGRTAAAMTRTGSKDGAAWPRYRSAMTAAAGVLAPLLSAPPASLDHPHARDIWELLKAGRRFRGLGRATAQSLLRWLPMPLYDFTHEWFENDRLCALVAARGLSGSMLAPRSAGGTLVLLLREAHRLMAGGRPLVARGGPGACLRAMAAAAQDAGAEIRTGVTVERIVAAAGRVQSVVADGREIAATHVLSTADPKTTFLTLLEGPLPEDARQRLRNFRSTGTLAKVNLALSGLPSFVGMSNSSSGDNAETRLLSGRIHIGERLDDLERAFDPVKYGDLPEVPWLDVSIPSVLDRSLAPSGAVASIYVHSVTEGAGAGGNAGRTVVLERTLTVLERYAPGIRSLIIAAEVATPADFQISPGMWGGHIFHGELAPDQLFASRPPISSSPYRTPVEGLYLAGGGTHPGGFSSGISGELAAREALTSARR
jgi:phytoene dehydrogenase-like protein